MIQQIAILRASETTYIYFEILLICCLTGKESVAVIVGFVVGASVWIWCQRGIACTTKSVGVFIGLVLGYWGQVCRRVARVGLVRLIRRHHGPICPVGSRLNRAVPPADRDELNVVRWLSIAGFV